MVLGLDLEFGVLDHFLALLGLCLLGVLLAVLDDNGLERVDEGLCGGDGGVEGGAVDLELGDELDESVGLVDLLLYEVGEGGGEGGRGQQEEGQDTQSPHS